MPDKGDAPAARDARYGLDHVCRLVTGCESLQDLHWRTIFESRRQQIRSLAGA